MMKICFPIEKSKRYDHMIFPLFKDATGDIKEPGGVDEGEVQSRLTDSTKSLNSSPSVSLLMVISHSELCKTASITETSQTTE